MATRNAARLVARKLGANVNYDLRMYEAIAGLREWSAQDVVFDVGANDGRTIFRLMRHLPAPRIFAFEPVSSTFEVLTGYTQALENVSRYRLALGAEEGRRTMYLNERAALNSLYPEWGESRGTEEIQITTLDRFVAREKVGRIHLLKIDAEGHDLEVLKGAEQCLHDDRVDIIQVEAGFSAPVKPQPSLEEIRSYLARFGYYLHGIYNQCRHPVRRPAAVTGEPAYTPPILIFCDALFVSANAGTGVRRSGD